MTQRETVLIVGGGQAGAWASWTLRTEGFEGRIVLAGAEPHPPYERPPLSKKALTGAQSEPVFVRARTDYAQLDIDLRTNAEIAEIDLHGRRALTRGGEAIGFNKMVLATGSAIRHLQIAGADLENVVYLRTLDDASALRLLLLQRPRTVIIGGGFIALEVASSARALQCDVTVLEVQSALMRRVAPPEISGYFERLHRDNGVKIHLNITPMRLEGSKRVERVVCADGRQFEADLVVVAIGVDPATALAAASGVATDNGILVDAFGQTSHPDIFAAGDVTNHPNGLLQRRVRLESWQNAQNQAISVAKAICGKPAAYNELPWFWSDQHGVNLQIAGLPMSWDTAVVRGNVRSSSFSIFYLQGQCAVGVSTINSPRDMAIGRRLVERRTVVSAAALADTGMELKSLLK